jgi:hypothetical protein
VNKKILKEGLFISSDGKMHFKTIKNVGEIEKDNTPYNTRSKYFYTSNNKNDNDKENIDFKNHHEVGTTKFNMNKVGRNSKDVLNFDPKFYYGRVVHPKDKFSIDVELYTKVPSINKISRSPGDVKRGTPTIYSLFGLGKYSNEALLNMGFIAGTNDTSLATPVYVFESLIKGRDKYINSPAKSLITNEFIDEFLKEAAKFTKMFYQYNKVKKNQYQTIYPSYIVTAPSRPMNFPSKYSGKSLVEHWAIECSELLKDEVKIDSMPPDIKNKYNSLIKSKPIKWQETSMRMRNKYPIKKYYKKPIIVNSLIKKNKPANMEVDTSPLPVDSSETEIRNSINNCRNSINRWQETGEISIGNVRAQNRWRCKNVYAINDDTAFSKLSKSQRKNTRILLLDDNTDTGYTITNIYWKLIDIGFEPKNIVALTLLDMKVELSNNKFTKMHKAKKIELSKGQNKAAEVTSEIEKLNNQLDEIDYEVEKLKGDELLTRIYDLEDKLKVINKEIEQLLADEREAYNKTFKGKHDILNAQLLKKLQNKSDEVENKINNAQEEEIAENYQHLLTWKKFKTN